MDVIKLLKAWALLAVGVLIAAHTSGEGIHYETPAALVVAVLLLSLCNVVLKPLLMLFSLPFIILTFGIGIWLINALLFLLVGAVVPDFHVLSFWYALWGAFVVSLTGVAASALFGDSRVKVRANVRVNRGVPPNGTDRLNRSNRPNGAPKRKPLKDDDDVIDI